MDFFIKKNATLPVLKLSVVKDGRSDYNKFMDMIEESAIFFSMVDVETGIPKISSRPAGFVEKTFVDLNAGPEYYIYYQFTPRDTNRVGRYAGQFMLRNSDGVLILPIREELFINVQDSFIADDLVYDSCYVSEFPCCINGPYTTTTTTECCPCTTTTTTINHTTTTTTISPVLSEVNMGSGIYDDIGHLFITFIADGAQLIKCIVEDYVLAPPFYIIGGENYYMYTPLQIGGTIYSDPNGQTISLINDGNYVTQINGYQIVSVFNSVITGIVNFNDLVPCR
jgi:hypothetical protein